MKKLTDKVIIRIMKEEWDAKIASLTESLTVAAQVKGEAQPSVSPELKVIHTASRIRYTIDSVSMRDVVLRTPEGEKFTVDSKTLNDEYEVA